MRPRPFWSSASSSSAAGLPIAYHAAKCGIDIDLLTRGAGFAYRLDHHLADLRVLHLHLLCDRSRHSRDRARDVLRHSASDRLFISAVVIIPLVTYGITLISRFQLWTQPLWIVLHILPFAAIAYANPHSFAEWRKFAGEHGDPSGQLDLPRFGTAASVVFGGADRRAGRLQISAARPADSRASWWIALLSAGPGWIISLARWKLLAGSFLAFFALSHGVSSEHAAEPAHIPRSLPLRSVAARPGAGADRHVRDPGRS